MTPTRPAARIGGLGRLEEGLGTTSMVECRDYNVGFLTLWFWVLWFLVLVPLGFVGVCST